MRVSAADRIIHGRIGMAAVPANSAAAVPANSAAEIVFFDLNTKNTNATMVTHPNVGLKFGRWLDTVLMRMTDLFLSFPFLVALIIASKLSIFQGLFGIVLLLALLFWMPDARIVRGVFLSLKEKEYVEAARSSGASNKRIIFYHIMPNALGPIIVNVTLLVAAAILTESALSFLGFGIAPPTPTWGNLLSDSQPFMLLAPWLVWFPGLMILITVLCVNFVGDGLRDALDPHQRIGGHE